MFESRAFCCINKIQLYSIIEYRRSREGVKYTHTAKHTDRESTHLTPQSNVTNKDTLDREAIMPMEHTTRATCADVHRRT